VLIADAVPSNMDETNPNADSFDSKDSYNDLEEGFLRAALSNKAETPFP
jgi:hypothetical protein